MLSKKMQNALPFVGAPLSLMFLKLIFTLVSLEYLCVLAVVGCLGIFARRAHAARAKRTLAQQREMQLRDMLAEEEQRKSLQRAREERKRRKALGKKQQKLMARRAAKRSKEIAASEIAQNASDAPPSSESDDDEFLAQWSQSQRKRPESGRIQGRGVARKRNIKVQRKIFENGIGEMMTSLKDMACPGTNPVSREGHTGQWLVGDPPLSPRSVESAQYRAEGSKEDSSQTQQTLSSKKVSASAAKRKGASTGGGTAKAKGKGSTITPVGVIGDGRSRGRGRARFRRKRPTNSSSSSAGNAQ